MASRQDDIPRRRIEGILVCIHVLFLICSSLNKLMIDTDLLYQYEIIVMYKYSVQVYLLYLDLLTGKVIYQLKHCLLFMEQCR